MSKNVALFIDVANIYYAARGQDVDVDYIALLKHVTKGRDLIRAYAYSGLDPENENQRKFLDFLSKNDYKVVHKDIRKFGDGRVKANLDIELVVDLFRLQDRMDIAVIVSGDGDFASAIRALQDVGVRCEVISFRPNTSSDLIAVADEFTDIMKIIGIGRAKTSKHMAMPEMPAKEVNPEFGFREASRGVAAAALAALREGDKPARSPRRRTSRSAAEARPDGGAEEAATETASETATAEPGREQAEGEGSRRRRRRRGGRGRGRSRRVDEPATTTATETAGTEEVGWHEFDDVSELTDLGEPGEERTYEFTEADAETLAALGLEADAAASAAAPDEVPAETPASADAGAASAPKRRSTRGGRGRGKASAGESEAAGDATSDAGSAGTMASEPVGETAEPTKPTRRGGRRTAKTAAASEGVEPAAEAAGAAQPEAPKTSRRSRSRKTTEAGSTEAPPAESGSARPSKPASRARSTGSRTPRASRSTTKADDGSEAGTAPDGDEGIWQRFRSARGETRRQS